MDAAVIAVTTYVVSHSVGSAFASKHGYEIQANQEFLAQGCSNVFGSLFSSLPMACSLSRSVILMLFNNVVQNPCLRTLLSFLQINCPGERWNAVHGGHGCVRFCSALGLALCWPFVCRNSIGKNFLNPCYIPI